jgi:IS30 family transposase
VGDGVRRFDSRRRNSAQASTSTISREIKRTGDCDGYSANQADEAAWGRARLPKRFKLSEHLALAGIVSQKLRTLWSPEQIESPRVLRRLSPLKVLSLLKTQGGLASATE